MAKIGYGTKQILISMRNLVSPTMVHNYAIEATQEARSHDEQISAVFYHVKNLIHSHRYTSEALQTPYDTLNYGAGDADDVAVLVASLLEALNFKTRFKVVAVNHKEFHHVYTQVFQNGMWIALDPLYSDTVGGEPHSIKKSAVEE